MQSKIFVDINDPIVTTLGCFLDASEAAFSLYKKLGFQVYGITYEFELTDPH